MEIIVYIQELVDITNYHCEEHALRHLFNYKEDMLARVKNGEDTSLIDDDGLAYSIIHEDTFQYEEFPGQIIPLEGIKCSFCDTELYPPFVGAE